MSAQERTAQATEKHLKSVRSKGQLQKARDLPAWLSVGVATALIPMIIASAQQAAESQIFAFRDIIRDPTPASALASLGTGLLSVLGTVWPLLVVVALTVIAATAAQGGIHVKKLKAHFEQFDLLKGIRNMFGARSAWELGKTLGKAALVGIGLYVVIQGLIPLVLQTGGLSVPALVATAQG